MDKKKERKFFTIMEFEKEQEYLQKMHKEGWKLVKVTGLGLYHFEKCEPENVIYQLDYNEDGIKHKDEYIQMFKDCGWDHIINYLGFSYFRKLVSNLNESEEIFCDHNSKFEMQFSLTGYVYLYCPF